MGSLASDLDLAIAPGNGASKEEPTAEFPQDEEGCEASQDRFIISWNGDDDPENPKNWSWKVRWSHIILLSLLTFVT